MKIILASAAQASTGATGTETAVTPASVSPNVPVEPAERVQPIFAKTTEPPPSPVISAERISNPVPTNSATGEAAAAAPAKPLPVTPTTRELLNRDMVPPLVVEPRAAAVTKPDGRSFVSAVKGGKFDCDAIFCHFPNDTQAVIPTRNPGYNPSAVPPKRKAAGRNPADLWR